MPTQGTLVMIDGIAGSGKSTILKAARGWFADSGARIFDLGVWSETHTTPPTFSDAKEADVLFTFEPTRTWIGSAIRQELSRTDAPYSAYSLATAFALDRELMYRRLIIPALAEGKIVIQDRGVSTSIVYQPIMDNTITLEEVLRLPGNALALTYAPHHLILPRIPATLAYERSSKRAESKGVFSEVLPHLETWNERFHSDWFAKLFKERGSTIHSIQTDTPLAETLSEAKRLFTNIFHL